MHEQKQQGEGNWDRPSEDNLVLTTADGGKWSFMLTGAPNYGITWGGTNPARFGNGRVSAVVSKRLALALRDALVDWYGPGNESDEEAEMRRTLDKVGELLDDADIDGMKETVHKLRRLLGKTPNAVGDALDHLPVRSVVKFDCDFYAQYTRTRKGWQDVADGMMLEEWFLNKPADRYPFQVKYNPEED